MQIPTSSSQKCQPPEEISAPLPAFPNEPGRTVRPGSIREIGVQFAALPIVYFSCLLVPSCQKKANKADWDGQSILDQRGSLEGCQGFYSRHDSLLLVGFFLNWNEEYNAPLSELCTWFMLSSTVFTLKSWGLCVCIHIPVLLFLRKVFGVCHVPAPWDGTRNWHCSSVQELETGEVVGSKGKLLPLFCEWIKWIK